jgi:hypothetical protein
VNGAETKMTVFKKAPRARLVAAAHRAAVGGGSAGAARRRASGSSGVGPGDRRTAAVLIESTEPVAYAVSRPDPLTVLVDLRNVSVGTRGRSDAQGPVAGVTLEQATRTTAAHRARPRRARVAVRLQGPQRAQRDPPRARAGERRAAPTRRCPSSRPGVARRHARVRPGAATQLDKVRAATRARRPPITLAGNGRLTPVVADRIRRPAAPPRARLPERVARAARARTSTACSSSRCASRSTAASRC